MNKEGLSKSFVEFAKLLDQEDDDKIRVKPESS
jgi:hypothetical protein